MDQLCFDLGEYETKLGGARGAAAEYIHRRTSYIGHLDLVLQGCFKHSTQFGSPLLLVC